MKENDINFTLKKKKVPLNLDNAAWAVSTTDEWHPGRKSQSLIFSSAHFTLQNFYVLVKYTIISPQTTMSIESVAA